MPAVVIIGIAGFVWLRIRFVPAVMIIGTAGFIAGEKLRDFQEFLKVDSAPCCQVLMLICYVYT